jgi:hypothetical protein
MKRPFFALFLAALLLIQTVSCAEKVTRQVRS